MVRLTPDHRRSVSQNPFYLLCFPLLALFLLLYNLSGPVLFEPDEGRNAEIGREILLLNDWTIPHYNFVPRLDKPAAYYWPTALSYRLFGISE